jgi:lysophospholipase L1-like esterase
MAEDTSDCKEGDLMQSTPNNTIHSFIALIALTLILTLFAAGCGGGDGDSDSNSNNGNPPIADAGNDQVVSEGQTVQLNGSQSTGTDGIIQAYQWRQTGGPEIVLTDADTANASFSAPLVSVAEELSFELTVTDEKGLQDSDQTNILVRDNLPPIADAGDDQQVLASQVVALNATNSSDSDGTIAAYQWTQVSGSSIAGDPNFDNSSATPTFTAPDSSGTIRFNLTVTDNNGFESTDQVAIYINEIFFEDDFSQGLQSNWALVDDSAGSGNNSSWNISGNALRQNNYVASPSQGPAFDQTYHQGTYRYLNTAMDLTDYRFQVEITPLTNGSSGGEDGNDVGIMFRYLDQNNYYRLSMSSRYGFTRLEKKKEGQFTSMAVNSIGYFDDIPMELVVEVTGSLIQVFIDNDAIFSVVDADFASGSVALYCQDRVIFDDVMITNASLMPGVVIASPLAYAVATTDTSSLNVDAHAANSPDGARVEFLLNDADSRTDLQPPFSTQYNGLEAGDYTVTAVLRDSEGNELARDTNQTVGVRGGFHIAVGNSITNGSGDRYTSDNLSADGRNVSQQGYESLLNDQLTNSFGLPQIVFNEGIPGAPTSDALGQIDSIVARHSNANSVLLLLGTNDAAALVATSDFIDNIESLVSTIRTAGMTVRVAQVPPQFDAATGQPDTTANNRIEEYNNALALLAGVEPGPDLYSYFSNNAGLFDDGLHPNSLGHACLARLWSNTITGANDTTFLLNQFQAPPLYQQNLLEAGNAFYIDANYTLETVPAELAHGVWIMTADADATETSTSFISFDLDRSATVYVAYDGRGGTVLPNWLSDSYSDTGLDITTTAGSFDLFSRSYAATTVTLDGNRAGGGTGVRNYCVVVVPD